MEGGDWTSGKYGGALEFDSGDESVNLGDITGLNSASEFTISFWMNQDVISQYEIIFMKYKAIQENIAIHTHTDGNMYFRIETPFGAYGTFNYTAVMNAGEWHHIAGVFDGSLSGDANRMKLYVDGVLQTLSFQGSVRTATADLSGYDGIGKTARVDRKQPAVVI